MAFVTLSLYAKAGIRDVQDTAGHADPRATWRYDRARHNFDRHPTHALTELVTSWPDRCQSAWASPYDAGGGGRAPGGEPLGPVPGGKGKPRLLARCTYSSQVMSPRA
jgi:hypothetical protein